MFLKLPVVTFMEVELIAKLHSHISFNLLFLSNTILNVF